MAMVKKKYRVGGRPPVRHCLCLVLPHCLCIVLQMPCVSWPLSCVWTALCFCGLCRVFPLPLHRLSFTFRCLSAASPLPLHCLSRSTRPTVRRSTVCTSGTTPRSCPTSRRFWCVLCTAVVLFGVRRLPFIRTAERCATLRTALDSRRRAPQLPFTAQLPSPVSAFRCAPAMEPLTVHTQNVVNALS